MLDRRVSTIAVMNGKGGSGKTTLVTNMAACYASRGETPVVVDYDPQASSTRWLKPRPSSLRPIHGINLTDLSNSGRFSRSWQFQIPHDATRVILDTPAGLSGTMLDEVVQRADAIIIPVLPSAHDVRASARFIAELLMNAHFRRRKPSICVVANRVERGTLVFGKLQRFLYSLEIPFVATFSDNRYYLQAAEKGVGICEIATRFNEEELREWDRLLGWIDKEVSGLPKAQSMPSIGLSQSPQSVNSASPPVFPASPPMGFKNPFDRTDSEAAQRYSPKTYTPLPASSSRSPLFGTMKENPGSIPGVREALSGSRLNPREGGGFSSESEAKPSLSRVNSLFQNWKKAGAEATDRERGGKS